MDWSPRDETGQVGRQWAEGRMGPGGERQRVEDNLCALRVLRDLDGDNATPAQQQKLARWTAWGAVPAVFDESRREYDDVRAELRSLVSESEYSAARRTTVNAHYTDPRIVEAMWQAVTDLGIESDALVLEPGSGVGTFMGLAPAAAEVTGVELDPATARIAQALYPSQTVRAESFADTTLPPGTFDLAIGNVPFGDVRLYDPVHNPGRVHPLHNHFLVKSLDLVRPGGMVACLTSRYTMDSLSATSRRALHDRADLVTAIRLPSGTHMATAGTEAVTDLLIFRRRLPGEEPRQAGWLDVVDVPVASADAGNEPVTAPLNQWWVDNPHLVLGTHELGHGMYGAQTLTVRPRGNVQGDLRAVLASSTRAAAMDGLTATPPAVAVSERRAALAEVPTRVANTGEPSTFVGFLRHDVVSGTFTETTRYGAQAPVAVTRKDTPRLAHLLQTRDTMLRLLDAESATAHDTDEVVELRKRLNDLYDGYVDRWGPINQVKISTSSRLDKNNDPIVSRRYPAVTKTLRNDPFGGALMGLEVYDEETGLATKAAILRGRVVAAREVITRVDTPLEAVRISVERVGRVDVDVVADLLATDVASARDQLVGVVFEDPTVPGRLVPRAEYLSGNVRQALKVAEEAALEDGRFTENVKALREVQPTDLTPGEITPRLGAVWIDAPTVQRFAREVLKDQAIEIESSGGSSWSVRRGLKYGAMATQTYGTDRMPAPEIISRLLQQKAVIVEDTYTDADGRERRVLNPTETAAAQDKAEQIADKFADWLWSNPGRSERLCRVYNDRFNAIRLRDYAEDGAQLTFPGLAASFTPHPHQRTAVARMLAEPSVGLFHGVGAGKTAEMVMGAMELRRLGMVEKPCVAVPNHMLDQVTREWLQLYPRAKVLAAGSSDLTGEGRRAFIGRAAAGDWDAVILTHGALGVLDVSKETGVAYQEAQVAEHRATKERAVEAGLSDATIKSLEKQIMRHEEKLKAKLAGPSDPGLTFEQSGIDYLMVDELHLFKNLSIQSSIQGVGVEGSSRAQRLDLKIDWLRRRATERAELRPGAPVRVLTGATATPIANSVAEAYVMQHYLRPDLLLSAGITDFDSWAATFGVVVTELEMRPDGGYGPRSRFARFDNLPELLQMWHVAADVCTSEQLNLAIPAQRERGDGARVPETVVVPASDELKVYMTHLADRAEQLRGGGRSEKGADNMLVVTTDGRKAALDLRMLDRSRTEPVDSGPRKVDVVAEKILSIWEDTRDRTYLDHDSGEPHPTPGALQIVFADLGTPSSDPQRPWSFYTELRRQLEDGGIPPGMVRFVQDANTDDKKARLFADARAGKVAVLMGSTGGMGVGTNVQTRAVSLHHVDCPWRPADVEQREGRILRQRNQNPEVGIYRYVSEGSFDAFSWQTVERKARFIAQLMHGDLNSRSAEDIDSGQALSFAEVKALASGEPLLLERAETEQRVKKLERLEVAHQRNQQQRAHTIRSQERNVEVLTAAAGRLEDLETRRRSTEGDLFEITIDDNRFTSRADAATAMKVAYEPMLKHLKDGTYGREVALGRVQIGGVAVELTGYNSFTGVTVQATYDDQVKFDLETRGIKDGSLGPVTRIENRVAALPRVIEDVWSRVGLAEADKAEAQSGLGVAYAGAGELREARRRLSVIDKELSAKKQPPKAPGTVDPTPATGHQPHPPAPPGGPLHPPGPEF